MRISNTINLAGVTNIHIRAKPRKTINLTPVVPSPVKVQTSISVVPSVPNQSVGSRKVVRQKAGCGCGRR
jgi:hypothetical protein